eukprot:TRINITY_DN48502_c0_g1_i1.p1 TRINITY_DN48502_c0_g1~~TRINITY_DN48502_c0_g1_i1.p1  ORF type:complete len:241 (+),score=46.16 TRINITY_DN48502_c0_g1_i1:70-723(+)
MGRGDPIHDEEKIEILTDEITGLIRKTRMKINSIGKDAELNDEEKKMRNNLQASFASYLQNLSKNFRKKQTKYLERMTDKKSRIQKGTLLAALSGELDEPKKDEYVDPGFSDAQLDMLQMTAVRVDQRDEELRKIAQSINELTTIMEDISLLVIEQGTLLDRIDYNIEMTLEETKQGVEQLEKAEKETKKSTVKICIIVLAIVIAGLILALIIKAAV